MVQRTWPRRPLGEVAGVGSGYAFKSSEFGNRGIPVIKIKNVRVGEVDLSSAEFVDEKYLSIPERYHVRQGDVLISLTGSHISQPNSVVGRVARHAADLPECLLNQRVGKILLKDTGKSDLCFLYYALSEQETVRAIAMKAHGAANQANVSPTQVESIEIPLPPLPVQRRIAGILSAYDELIENSQRRIKILEAMARALYREWFVHFRFPGHESVPRVPSPLGDIPQGWEVRKVAEFAEFTRGFEPGSNAYAKEPSSDRVRFVRVGDLSKRDSSLYIAAQLAEGRVLGPLDIAITLDGSVGEVRLGLDGAYSSGIRRVDVKDKSRLGWVFAYQLLLADSSQATIQAHAKGTTIKHAGSAVGALTFVSPPRQLVELFEANAAPMIRSALRLQQRVENLRRTRDLLLPRLLSGQIDVEAMPS
jgi:type I restriction enzyme S subunit